MLTLRWQVGNYGQEPWRALDYSIRLMKRLEPDAIYNVTHQGDVLIRLDGVNYYPQDKNLGVRGHHYPTRFNADSHEVWIDNDHIMWALPPAWEKFKQSNDIPLVWQVDWDYYGVYTHQFERAFHISSGIWGLPPNETIPPSIIPDSVEGDDMGWIAMHLAKYKNHAKITLQEVNCYQPEHVVLGKNWDHFGTHGVHLVGMNRGWNGEATNALDRIQKEHNL